MEAFALSHDAVRVPVPQRMLSDDRLLRLVAAGNPQAFGTVYARYHAPLYAYCRSIVRDPDDARDALQNTMMKALAALGRGEERDLPLKPWLFRIAHNESISLLRRRRPSEPLTDQVSPPVAGVEAQVVERERLSQLVEDLQELPERQRAALLMREVSGLGYEEIAGALGVSEGAARQTVFEARSALTEYNEGRDVACEHIRRSISDGDGRAMRARRVRAHLRSCNACRDFQTTLKVRRRELALLAPGLSGGTAVALLQTIVGAGAGVAGGGAAAGGAGLLGGSASALLAGGAAKSVAVLAAVTAAGVGATEVAHVGRTHRYRRAAIPAGPVTRPSGQAAGVSGGASRSVGAPGSPALSGPVFPGVGARGGAGRHRSVVLLGRPDDALAAPVDAPVGNGDGAGKGAGPTDGATGDNGKGPASPDGGAADSYYSGWAAPQSSRPARRPQGLGNPTAVQSPGAQQESPYPDNTPPVPTTRPIPPRRPHGGTPTGDPGGQDTGDDTGYDDSADGSGDAPSSVDSADDPGAYDASGDDSGSDGSGDDSGDAAPVIPDDPGSGSGSGYGSGSGSGSGSGTGGSGGGHWHRGGSVTTPAPPASPPGD